MMQSGRRRRRSRQRPPLRTSARGVGSGPRSRHQAARISAQSRGCSRSTRGGRARSGSCTRPTANGLDVCSRQAEATIDGATSRFKVEREQMCAAHAKELETAAAAHAGAVAAFAARAEGANRVGRLLLMMLRRAADAGAARRCDRTTHFGARSDGSIAQLARPRAVFGSPREQERS